MPVSVVSVIRPLGILTGLLAATAVFATEFTDAKVSHFTLPTASSWS